MNLDQHYNDLDYNSKKADQNEREAENFDKPSVKFLIMATLFSTSFPYHHSIHGTLLCIVILFIYTFTIT